MAEITLGVNNCFAIGRFPEPDVWLGIVKDDLGLSHVQFSFDLLDPVIVDRETLERKCRFIRDRAASRGVVIDTAITGEVPHKSNALLDPDPEIRQCYLRWFEHMVHAAAVLGADATGVYLGTLSQKDQNDPERRAFLVTTLLEEITALTVSAKLEGLHAFLWEPMSIPREPPCTIRETRELLLRVNEGTALPVKLCLDVGHGWYHSPEACDRDPYSWIREFGSVSPVIHMQQTDGKGSRHWPFTDEYNAAGIIMPEKVFAAVEESGAEAVEIVFEFFYSAHALSDETALDKLKASVEYWQNAVRKAYG